jgi:hypothetical protein
MTRDIQHTVGTLGTEGVSTIHYEVVTRLRSSFNLKWMTVAFSFCKKDALDGFACHPTLDNSHNQRQSGPQSTVHT